MKRIYVWVPKPENENYSQWVKIPINKKPDAIWTIINQNENNRPPEDLPLVHFKTALIEDYIHDWNWTPKRPNEIKYYSRFTSGPVWIALLYNDTL